MPWRQHSSHSASKDRKPSCRTREHQRRGATQVFRGGKRERDPTDIAQLPEHRRTEGVSAASESSTPGQLHAPWPTAWAPVCKMLARAGAYIVRPHSRGSAGCVAAMACTCTRCMSARRHHGAFCRRRSHQPYARAPAIPTSEPVSMSFRTEMRSTAAAARPARMPLARVASMRLS